MKILIISHYYKHKNAMASVRPVKLAKYFSRFGHDVTVLTSMQKDNWCKQELTPVPSDDIREIYAPAHKGMAYLIKVYDFMQRRGQRKIMSSKQTDAADVVDDTAARTPGRSGLKSRLKQKLSWLFYYGSDRLENYFLTRGLIDAARKNSLSGFDIVIASYPGAGVHAAGEWFKKSKRTLRFIADYRDPAYNPGGRSNKTELRHDKRVQDKAVRCADAVVCVSQGMADSLKMQYDSCELPQVHVVTNGFDPDDNQSSEVAGLDTRKFNFVYTGALYQGRRSVDMLTKVLRKLVDEGVVAADRLALNYAGPDFGELVSQLRRYRLESIAVDFGYVSRQMSLGMQQEADMVLLLNWNDDNYTGVIPGKLYEYMASKRPICALVMGNRAGSESARMIREHELGCACEQASSEDLDALEAYIRRKLVAFNSGCRETVASEGIRRFEYENIARRYLDIVDSVCR